MIIRSRKWECSFALLPFVNVLLMFFLGLNLTSIVVLGIFSSMNCFQLLSEIKPVHVTG